MDETEIVLKVLKYLLVTFVIFVTVMIGWSNYLNLTETCEDEIHTLKAVNGITDENSGLFSGGDTSTTSLLFEDGLIVTFTYRITSPLQLGEPMIIQRCTQKNGNIVYRR